MERLVGRWLEILFLLIMAYLILANAAGFSTAIRSLGQVQIASIKALQGRS